MGRNERGKINKNGNGAAHTGHYWRSRFLNAWGGGLEVQQR